MTEITPPPPSPLPASPLPDSAAPGLATQDADLAALQGDTLPDEAVLKRADQKPPLYRFFRVGIYLAYWAIVVWFVAGITLSIVNSVWGPPGTALKARESRSLPVAAEPR
jgi:hypothetical protein